MEEERICPTCQSTNTVKNGSTRHGKAKRSCKDCGRQYTIDPAPPKISPETWEMVQRMYLEGLSIRAISRITGISLTWLCIKIARFSEEVDEEMQTDGVEKKQNP